MKKGRTGQGLETEARFLCGNLNARCGDCGGFSGMGWWTGFDFFPFFLFCDARYGCAKAMEWKMLL